MPTVAPARGEGASRSRRATLGGASTARDAAVWLALVAAGAALTVLAVRLRAPLHSQGVPFIGFYRWRLRPATGLAAAVAVVVVVAVRRGVPERLPVGWLLLASYCSAAVWSLALALVDGRAGLAGPLATAPGYLSDVATVDDPASYLRHFVARAGDYSVETRQHPPAPVLLLWTLRQVGVSRPTTLGVLITLVGCLTVPLVAVSVRSLCGAASARRLVPVLALAPYAVWVAVSMDAVTMTLTAAALTCGVVASEPRRSGWWAATGGVLLGMAALFSYSAGWLAVSLILVYFVRRRPLLNVATGVGALVPLAVVRAAGFVWPNGLTAAQADISQGVGAHRSWLIWAVLDVFVLLLAAGPSIVPAGRKMRRTPGWPFLVGAGLAVAFALAFRLSRGEVERSWLPFYPWLLVACVAPERRPAAGDPTAADSAPTPVLLVILGALAAITIVTVVRTAW